ncbi:hypothetical protein AXF42_Ash013290 [Apostasia shenzhenica]|uniref:Uncharacterized protein n=1 Tax=Apostasia shenzhenica TaxID=1088818 RepID=A0A2I0BBN5_9ASPA|nr:hypothetical protein AXF42_Ash013290 [Apostasia shenzhenica]
MALFFHHRRFLIPFPHDLRRPVPLSSNPKPFVFLPASTNPSSSSFLCKSLRKSPMRNVPFVSASWSTESKITNFETVVDELDSDEDLAASPWEGAVVYRRDTAATHVEYSTTLERLGLSKVSSGLSRSRASEMGIRLPARRAKYSDFGDNETPVLVSIDVTRRKRRLKLDGILRTVITLGCNRCAEPAAESVFSNFTLLLTEDPPIEDESDELDMGVIYGEGTFKSSVRFGNEEDDDEKQIDPDDRLYFPSGEKEIDLSKHIRDLVHVEITINAICGSSCKGLCLKCGVNLNKNKCNCSPEVAKEREYGPLKDLRKQMQR